MSVNRTKKLYEDLLDVAERLFGEVRLGQGQFQTGVCTIKGKSILILNDRQTLDERIAILSAEIFRAGADDIYIKPVVRTELERIQAAAGEFSEAEGELNGN